MNANSHAYQHAKPVMKRPTHFTGATQQRKPDTIQSRQLFSFRDHGIVDGNGVPLPNQVSMDEDYSNISINNVGGPFGNDTTTSTLLEGHTATTDAAANDTPVLDTAEEETVAITNDASETPKSTDSWHTNVDPFIKRAFADIKQIGSVDGKLPARLLFMISEDKHPCKVNPTECLDKLCQNRMNPQSLPYLEPFITMLKNIWAMNGICTWEDVTQLDLSVDAVPSDINRSIFHDKIMVNIMDNNPVTSELVTSMVGLHASMLSLHLSFTHHVQEQGNLNHYAYQHAIPPFDIWDPKFWESCIDVALDSLQQIFPTCAPELLEAVFQCFGRSYGVSIDTGEPTVPGDGAATPTNDNFPAPDTQE